MMFYLCGFNGKPPKEKPVGMNAIAAAGFYLDAVKAMQYLRPKAHSTVVFPSGEPITHYGLYDGEGKLVTVVERRP